MSIIINTKTLISSAVNLPPTDFSCDFIAFFDIKVGRINKTVGKIKIVARCPQRVGSKPHPNCTGIHLGNCI